MKNTKIKRMLVRWYEFYSVLKCALMIRMVYRIDIMCCRKSIWHIRKNKCSIARFGDGEFKLMLSVEDLAFQSRNDELAEKLKLTLSNKNADLLLCMPGCLNSLQGMNAKARKHWFEWGRRDDNHRKMVKMIWQYAGKKYRFGDAQITRPYIDWKTDKRARFLFPALKSLWADRDVLIVEGAQTRLGVGNDLLNGAHSIRRILAPAENAFDRYDDILRAVLKHCENHLILLALGPTATVLAADLSQNGCQALDIGHIDIEYEWYLRGVKEKIAIQGKYTNEVTEGRTFTDCNDAEYLNQIIERIE